MRRFSSEGSLLTLDFLPRRKVALKDLNNETSVLCTDECKKDALDGNISVVVPTIQEPVPGPAATHRLDRELSISAENLVDSAHLSVRTITESCRAYSDGQLRPAVGGGEKDDARSRSPSPTSCSPFTIKSQPRHQHRAKLSAAKLHLKSLFGQGPHSSNSSPTSTEPRDSSAERRSRMLFMHQWSQVGHSKKRISKDELEKWAESLDSLLASQNGVAVFEAFLRSEFSEENLLFYVACEQYKNSSTNFSLQKRAKHIYNTYIQPGAPREVNLDSKTRELTIQLLQAPSHTSLSHAQKRIYSLLDLDCYPRFLQSDMYQSLLHVPSSFK
ncbi:regulator of G-protein signaling 8 isoform X2 [Gouania willdenowi]|uniref:Regulator of G-protein signaling 8-like n=2 Tax=Gouania willdenowi TaxID=441366 RepID=A0A8C5DCQ2_GOUWI|nr:regulator of G-protein signaling 8-like isoform X2 [Gouania willdenowi]